MTPPLDWQHLVARIPTLCDGFHCHHSLIRPGEPMHCLPSDDGEGAIRLCDICWKAGQQPPPTSQGTIS